MITGQLKNKIDKIWDDMYSYGIANPLVVIEQLTYLFFIKSLDDVEIASVMPCSVWRVSGFSHRRKKDRCFAGASSAI